MHSGWIWNQQVSLLIIKSLHRKLSFASSKKNKAVELEVEVINAVFITTIYLHSVNYVVGT